MRRKRPNIDREALAKHLNYGTACEMYNDLYVSRNWSSNKIGIYLGLAGQTVLNDLRECKISIMPKGGCAVKSANSILDKICCLPLHILASENSYSIAKRLGIKGSSTIVKHYLWQHLGINKGIK